jgi:hypothetical protein
MKLFSRESCSLVAVEHHLLEHVTARASDVQYVFLETFVKVVHITPRDSTKMLIRCLNLMLIEPTVLPSSLLHFWYAIPSMCECIL